MNDDNLYQIQSPDATEYWIKMIKCQDACPVHTNACGYVTAIAEGRYSDAYRMARATNPFASISLRRLDSNVGEIPGTPRRISLKRLAPPDISPRMRIVQRGSSISQAIARGQNSPYWELVIFQVLPL